MLRLFWRCSVVSSISPIYSVFYFISFRRQRLSLSLLFRFALTQANEYSFCLFLIHFFLCRPLIVLRMRRPRSAQFASVYRSIW